MARRLRAQAEVVGRRHQPGAEMVQPDAIDDGPRRERIVARDNGLSQLQAPAALNERLALFTRNDLRHLAWNLVAFVLRIAADEDTATLWTRTIHQGHGPR